MKSSNDKKFALFSEHLMTADDKFDLIELEKLSC